MLTKIIDQLICPACLPQEHQLTVKIDQEKDDDIIDGKLCCPHCGESYRITQGIACLSPKLRPESLENQRYETEKLLSSYLWSHFADLMGDPEASTAYAEWSQLIASNSGWGLDIGAAVGRFSFEMKKKCDLVIGIDTSFSFIQAARNLLKKGHTQLTLPQEGQLSRTTSLQLPPELPRQDIEFIIGDAQALPFKSHTFATLSSLNLVDKLPQPLIHLKESNRVASKEKAEFLLSDPFSWAEATTPPENWLGGTESGPFAGSGLDNITKIMSNGNFTPAWKVTDDGAVWWKIRTHRNHFELIRSCYLKARR